MPASALLKFVQGATVGGDGRALVGVIGTSVNISNVNNTGVQSWQIDVAYADPTSAVAIGTLASNDASSTPAASFTPDVRRSYRIVLKVWDAPNRVGDPTSVDIRVFSVRELNGVLIPPSQVWPLPLPDPRTGELNAKPLEMNFDGQIEGWHGVGTDGLLSQVLARHIPPLPGNPGDVLTVSSGRWVSAPPSGGGSGDVSGPVSSVNDNIVLWDGTTGDQIKDSGLNLSAFIRHNGSVVFTANQSMGGFRITNAANAIGAQDLVTLAQMQAAINGLDPKGNVRAYSNTNVASLSGLGALGGVASFTDGQRVGLGGQSTGTQNGIWVVHAGAWTRPTDFATGMDVSGAYFIVEEGTFADREFLVTSDSGSAVVDTSNLTLVDFGTSSLLAGNGLQKIGNVISVLHDGGTLSSSGSGLKVAAGGITTIEIAAGAVNLTTQVTGLLPFSNLADGAATSVLGRGVNSIGVMASIAASADGQVLRRSGGALAFGAVDLADTDAVTGLLPFTNIASLTGLSVLGRSASTLGAMAAITGTDGQALRVAGTTLGFGTLATAAYADSSVTLAKLANATAASVLGRSANTIGAYADIASSADGQVLRRAAGAVTFGAVDLADADAVTGLLPFANIANGSANSVLGRAAGTVGVMASIAASADGQLLRMAAGALSFGAVDLADADAVTGQLAFTNMASLVGTSVLGRSAGTTGTMAAITASADDQVLQRSGGALVFASIATAGLADNSVTMAKLADLAGNSVIGRAANTTGDPAAITAGTAGQVLRLAGTTLGFGAVDLADADAVTGLLPGTNVDPNFGTSSAIIGGTLALGTNPASTGAIRLGNSSANGVRFRDAAGTGNNVYGVFVHTTDAIVVGDAALAGNYYLLTAGGSHTFTVAGTTRLSVAGSLTTLSSTVVEFATPTVRFDTAVASPIFGQEDDATASATGDTLQINAQNATGTTATGGALDLRSGTGTTAAGAFQMRIGSTIFLSYPGNVVPATAGILRVHHNATAIAGRNNANNADRNIMRWGITAADVLVIGDTTFASIVLGDDVTVGNTADTWMAVNGTANTVIFGASASPQAVVGVGFMSIGTNPASAGVLRLPNATNVRFRNAANSGDLIALEADGGDIVRLGNSADASVSVSSGQVLVRPAGTDRIQITDTVFEWRMTNVRFDTAVVSPVISQETDSTAGVTGDQLQINAQDVSGTGATVGGVLLTRAGNSTNGTGGGVDVRSGTGTTAAGSFTLRVGSTIFFSYPGTGIPATTGLLRMPNAQSITARNNANSQDLVLLSTNSSDGVFLGDTSNVASVSIQTTGARLIFGTSIEIQNSSQFRFDAAVATPQIIQEADSTTAATGDLFTIQAQQVTGIGATVGGGMTVRGGDSTNGTGGNLDLRTGVGVNATSSGELQLRVGSTVVFRYQGNTGTPSSSGASILRAYHNAEIISGRDSANATNIPLLRWGATANDLLTVGSSSASTEVLGTSVEIGDGSTYIEVATLAANREIIALLLGTDLTTTQMPANTGDKVLFWADASQMPTSGFPTGGGILGVDSALGFEWKGKNGIETTIAPHGDSGNTTKRRWDGWKSQPLKTDIASHSVATTCASFDVSNFNGGGVTDASFEVRARYTTRESGIGGGGYAGTHDRLAFVDVTAGVVTVIDTPASNRTAGTGARLSAIAIENSGTTIRLRLTVDPSANTPVTVFGYLEVFGYER